MKNTIITEDEIRIKAPLYRCFLQLSKMLFLILSLFAFGVVFVIFYTTPKDKILFWLLVTIPTIYALPLIYYITSKIYYKLSKTTIVINFQGITLFKEEKEERYIPREELRKIGWSFASIAGLFSNDNFVFYSKDNNKIIIYAHDNLKGEIERILDFKVVVNVKTDR